MSAEVRPIAVLRHFGIAPARRDRGVLLVRACPSCGPRPSASVSVSASNGRWFCESNRCRGELRDLIAGFAGVAASNALAVDAIIATITNAAARERAELAGRASK